MGEDNEQWTDASGEATDIQYECRPLGMRAVAKKVHERQTSHCIQKRCKNTIGIMSKSRITLKINMILNSVDNNDDDTSTSTSRFTPTSLPKTHLTPDLHVC